MAVTTIAAISDTHADATTRWEEHCRVMSWFTGEVDRRGVDLVLHAGDVYEAGSTPEERAFLHDWCQVITERRPLGIVGGNHEAPGDVTALGRLRTRHPIIATERAEVHELAGVSVAFFPWPRKANLLAALGGTIDAASSDAIAAHYMRNVLRGLGLVSEEHAGPRVLLGHVMIDGAYTDHDQPLIGGAMALSVADLALAGAHLNIVGHIHAQNDWAGPVPTVYPGAPRHCNFGEAGPRKGYLLARFDGARLLGWERVSAPCRAMLLVKARYEGGEIRFPPIDPAALVDAEVRIRSPVRQAERVAAAHAAVEVKAALLARGAFYVKMDPELVVTTVARSPEVAAAPTTAAALEARWRQRGEHNHERQTRLLGRLAQLEQESKK